MPKRLAGPYGVCAWAGSKIWGQSLKIGEVPGPSSSLSVGGTTGGELRVAGLPASRSASSSWAAGRGRAFATRPAGLVVALVSGDLAPSRPRVPRGLRSPAARREPQPQGLHVRPPLPHCPSTRPARGAGTCSQHFRRTGTGYGAPRHGRTKTPPPRSSGAGGAGLGWDFYDLIFNATGRESGKLLGATGPHPQG